MATRDIFHDLASLAYPTVPPDAVLEAGTIARMRADDSKRTYAENLRAAWETTEQDPLLAELIYARQTIAAAQKRLRLLIAYGREFVAPRPYRLEDLAEAAGMSISGVRTAYGETEVDTVTAITGAKPQQH
jgi:AraC-like DNA-binding protein